MHINPDMKFFIIEATSEEKREPLREKYLIRTRQSNGQWTIVATDLNGIFNIRRFLNERGVDEKRIALAVEELSRSGHVLVSSQSLQAA